MRVFVQKVFLPLSVVVVALLVITNPMNFDWVQRITGSLSVLFFAYVIVRRLYNKKKVAPPPQTRSEFPPPSDVTESPTKNRPAGNSSQMTPNPAPKSELPVEPRIAAQLIIDAISEQYINFHFQVENLLGSPQANDVRFSIKINSKPNTDKEFPPLFRTLHVGGKLSLTPAPFLLEPGHFNNVLLALKYNVEKEGTQKECTSTYLFSFERHRAKEGSVIEPQEFQKHFFPPTIGILKNFKR